MSYSKNGIGDILALFEPWEAGDVTPGQTGYQINGEDINLKLVDVSRGQPYAGTTGYSVAGTDGAELWAVRNSVPRFADINYPANVNRMYSHYRHLNRDGFTVGQYIDVYIDYLGYITIETYRSPVNSRPNAFALESRDEYAALWRDLPGRPFQISFIRSFGTLPDANIQLINQQGDVISNWQSTLDFTNTDWYRYRFSFNVDHANAIGTYGDAISPFFRVVHKDYPTTNFKTQLFNFWMRTVLERPSYPTNGVTRTLTSRRNSAPRNPNSSTIYRVQSRLAIYPNRSFALEQRQMNDTQDPAWSAVVTGEWLYDDRAYNGTGDFEVYIELISGSNLGGGIPLNTWVNLGPSQFWTLLLDVPANSPEADYVLSSTLRVTIREVSTLSFYGSANSCTFNVTLTNAMQITGEVRTLTPASTYTQWSSTYLLDVTGTVAPANTVPTGVFLGSSTLDGANISNTIENARTVAAPAIYTLGLDYNFSASSKYLRIAKVVQGIGVIETYEHEIMGSGFDISQAEFRVAISGFNAGSTSWGSGYSNWLNGSALSGFLTQALATSNPTDAMAFSATVTIEGRLASHPTQVTRSWTFSINTAVTVNAYNGGGGGGGSDPGTGDPQYIASIAGFKSQTQQGNFFIRNVGDTFKIYGTVGAFVDVLQTFNWNSSGLPASDFDILIDEFDGVPWGDGTHPAGYLTPGTTRSPVEDTTKWVEAYMGVSPSGGTATGAMTFRVNYIQRSTGDVHYRKRIFVQIEFTDDTGGGGGPGGGDQPSQPEIQ